MRRVINWAFLLAILLNFFLWYSGISLVGSIIKSFGDCDKEYKIEKYIKSDWFCPKEESTKEFLTSFNRPKARR
jgi:hypothetical protein